MSDTMKHLLDQIAQDKRPCKFCQQAIVIVQHANGKRAAYTYPSGVNHMIDCPSKPRPAAPAEPEQGRLFDQGSVYPR